MIFVVPTLIEQFKSFHGQLPFITNVLIVVSDGLTLIRPLILLTICGSRYRRAYGATPTSHPSRVGCSASARAAARPLDPDCKLQPVHTFRCDADG